MTIWCGFGNADAGQLVERRLGAVVLDLEALHEGRRGAAGADGLEVALHGLEGASHARLERLAGSLGSSRVTSVDERPDRLAQRGAADVVWLVHVEDDDGQVILHAQTDGRRVEHLQPVR